MTRLAIAEFTETEIATISGHSLQQVRLILDAHYLHRYPALGEAALKNAKNIFCVLRRYFGGLQECLHEEASPRTMVLICFAFLRRKFCSLWDLSGAGSE